MCAPTTEIFDELTDTGLEITQPAIIKFTGYIGKIKDHKDLKNINNLLSFKTSNRFSNRVGYSVVEFRCPLEGHMNTKDNPYFGFRGWTLCAMELFKLKLNCTVGFCHDTLYAIEKMDVSRILPFHFLMPHGNEFFGIKYSLFYNPSVNRNMFALLSPFKLLGWVVVLLTCYFVGLILKISTFGKNPFYWLLIVVLEQGDILKSQLNKINVIIVVCWIYGALMLRQAYTSNLFTYMTLEMGPSDLPQTFEETIGSDHVVNFGTYFIFNLLEEFKKAVYDQNLILQGRLYNLANNTITKLWNMDVDSGALKNIRQNYHGDPEICNLKKLKTQRYYEVDINSCQKQKTYAFLSTTGPAEWYAMTSRLTSKLLLKLNNTRLLIFESRSISLFQTSDLIVFKSNNFLKAKFGDFLASLSQSGIESLELKYVQRNFVKEFVKDKLAYTVDTKISNLVSHWLDNRCNDFYNSENCDLNLNKYSEVPVTYSDLTAIWLLLVFILMASIISFTHEVV